MPATYTVPWITRLNRAIFRPIFRGLFWLSSRPKIVGLENVPPAGAYLVAINHVSLYEAPFILAFWPTPLEGAGASDLWRRPGQSFLARLYGGIPVHRGEYDRRLLDTLLAVLRAGRPLVIAPEGGRSHTPGMRRGMPGLAWVVDQAQVPVVPVGIVGSTDDFLARALRGRRPAIEMRIGRAITLPPLARVRAGRQATDRHAARQQNVDQIMHAIAALLPPEYHGVYAQPASTPGEA